MYDWRLGRWVATDFMDLKLIQGDVRLEQLDSDPISEPLGGKADLATSIADTVDFLIGHPDYIGQNMENTFVFGVVEESLPWALDKMIEAGRRWVVILETLGDPTKYVQVLVTASGSMWAECVSNNFLDDEHCLDDDQCELLPSLGWEWPGPPALPKWHLHDELLDTGPVMSGLMIRTMRRVFGIGSDDRVRVIMLPLAEHGELLDQR